VIIVDKHLSTRPRQYYRTL